MKNIVNDAQELFWDSIIFILDMMSYIYILIHTELQFNLFTSMQQQKFKCYSIFLDILKAVELISLDMRTHMKFTFKPKVGYVIYNTML